MKKKKLENILNERLGNARIEPPAGMWDRIAKDLPGRQPEREDVGMEADQIPPEPVVVTGRPAITIRVPRKLRIGYAAAASVLLVMLMIGLRQVLKEELLATGEEPQAEDVIREFNEPEVQGIPIEAGEEAGLRNKLRNTVASSLRNYVPSTERMPVAPAAYIDVEGIAASFESMEDVHVWKIYRHHEAFAEYYREYRGEGSLPKITSDKRTSGVPVDWARVLAEEDRRTRRATPLKLSLYSGDLGSSSSETNVKEAAGKTFVVTEKTDGSGVIISGAPGLADIAESQEFSLKHKMPVTVGLNLSFGLARNLSIETGLSYSYLFSKSEDFTSSSGIAYQREQKLHYVGIPLYVRYDFIGNNRVAFYGSAGGMLEKCVSGIWSTSATGESKGSKNYERLNVKGLQGSVGAALGGELKLYGSLGLYVEPGVNFYFRNNNQPESYRTRHRLNFSLRAGLRFHIN